MPGPYSAANPPPGYRAPSSLERDVFGSGATSIESLPVRAGLNLADRLSQEENTRHAGALQGLRGARDRANTMASGSLSTLPMQFGQQADMAMGQALDNWKGLSDYLGGAGITGGGLAAGLGAQIDLQRMAQMNEGQRDVAIKMADRSASIASDNFLRDLGVANFENQSPSMLLLDQLNGTANWNLDFNLGRAQINESRYNREESRRQADNAFWGDIITGGLSLGTSFLL